MWEVLVHAKLRARVEAGMFVLRMISFQGDLKICLEDREPQWQ